MVYHTRELSRRVINAALSNILLSMRAKLEGTYRQTSSPPIGGAAHAHIGICLSEPELRISSPPFKILGNSSAVVALKVSQNVAKIIESMSMRVHR